MPKSKYHELLLRRNADDWSKQPNLLFSSKDLDPEAISHLRNLIRVRNPSFIQSTDDKALFQQFGLLEDEKYTNACALLLGRASFLQKHLPQSEIRYLRYSKESPSVAITDKSFVRPLVLTLRDLENLFSPFISILPIQLGMFRAEVPILSWAIIQEAILNACTHRDYRTPANIYIKHHEDRITLTNPGGFLSGITAQNILISISISRNRLLAEVFQRLQYVQRAHQGTELIFSELLHWGKGEPEYQDTSSSVSLTVPTEIQDRAWIRFIVKTQEKNQQILDAKYDLLLWRLRNLEIASFETLLQELNQIFNKDSLNKALQYLYEKAFIQKTGRGRGTLYLLGKEYFSESNQRGRATKLKRLSKLEYESLIIQHIQENGPTAIGELIGQKGLDLTRAQAAKILSGLCVKTKLKKIGQGRRWVKYSIN